MLLIIWEAGQLKLIVSPKLIKLNSIDKHKGEVIEHTSYCYTTKENTH